MICSFEIVLMGKLIEPSLLCHTRNESFTTIQNITLTQSLNVVHYHTGFRFSKMS